MLNILGYEFREPIGLYGVSLPAIPAVYIILTIRSGQWKVLYVGETEDLAERGIPFGHHAHWKWMLEAGPTGQLWISWLGGPGFSEVLRRHLESRIIQMYNPPCNGTPQPRLSDLVAQMIMGPTFEM